MLRVNGCKLKLHQDKSELRHIISKKLNTKKSFEYSIVKESIDARKGEIIFNYSVDVMIDNEEKYLKYSDVSISKTTPFVHPKYTSFTKRPIVIGLGPSSLYCALLLAQCGAKPIVYERGSCVEKRMQDVEHFFKTGELNEQSNVQYGEGGAGTFSDGKLTSRSKDPRGNHVLEEFVRFGADEEILYQSHPHIGTDVLVGILQKMRKEILELGGEIYFDHTLEDIEIENNEITKIKVNDEWIHCDDLLLGIGHSARDTYRMLIEHKVACEPKNFAVGVRIEHTQEFVDHCQYGQYAKYLPAASYRLTHTTTTGRGVYTFCMCPGGEVIMATSQKGHVVTNGMSYHARNNTNANSAMLVQVTTDDIGKGIYDGMNFQEELERKAFEMGGKNYYAPIQRAIDFVNHKPTTHLGNIKPTYRLGTTYCDLHELFPEFINQALEEGLVAFNHKMIGFLDDNAIMSGVESRSTAPIRILRNEDCVSINVKNLYPMGEGAGYAGGIVSAAIDGIRCATEWMKKRGIL